MCVQQSLHRCPILLTIKTICRPRPETPIRYHSAWRHWGCVTSKILSNIKSQFESAEDLDGFEDLNEEDQERVREAYETGKVRDEDIPESARKPGKDEGEDEEEGEKKPAAKRGRKKKDEADGEEKEKPKRGRKKKDDGEEADGEEEKEKPKTIRARKAPTKVRLSSL